MSHWDLVRIGIWLLAIGVALWLLSYWKLREMWPHIRHTCFVIVVEISDRIEAAKERRHAQRSAKHRPGGGR